MEVRVNCPYCPTEDTKRHLYINTRKNVCHCKRCGWSGIWDRGTILPDLNKPNLSNKLSKVELFKFSLRPTGMNGIERLYLYCLDRLPQQTVDRFIRWSPDLQTRVFFPVWDGGKVIAWNARTIEQGITPRYLTWGNISTCIYNSENVADWAVLTEGPFDALTSPHGICTFGKNISSLQFDLMVSKYNRIYWAFDKDTANDKKLKETKQKMRRFIEVVDLDLPQKDPNSIGVEGMIRLLKERGANV